MNSDILEEYFDKPYWVIDILPKQVPADGQGQYFKIEEYWLRVPQISAICNKFGNLLIKLNCYYDISIHNTVGEWADKPSPETIIECLSTKKAVYVVLKSEDAMIGFTGEDHYMTLYNPNERLLELVKSLANSEGLFAWKPDTV